jgi:hypothetical protein
VARQRTSIRAGLACPAPGVGLGRATEICAIVGCATKGMSRAGAPSAS